MARKRYFLAVRKRTLCQRISNLEIKLWMIHQDTDSIEAVFHARILQQNKSPTFLIHENEHNGCHELVYVLGVVDVWGTYPWHLLR